MQRGLSLKDGLKKLKNLSNKSKQLIILMVWAGIILLASGCGVKRPAPETLPARMHPPQEKQERVQPVIPRIPPQKPVTPPIAVQPPKALPSQEPKPDARMMAAANLVEQGKIYLDGGKPDQAIDVLERALSVYPGNGKTHYYMAEAWVMKKNKRQALEFNRLARMYLSGDDAWRDKVADQQKRIRNLP